MGMIEIKLSRRCQNAVANLFGFETPRSMTPDIAIYWIDVRIASRDLGAKPVCASENNLRHQFLGGPSIADRLQRKIVQQLLIGWLIAHGVEVIHGVHHSRAK